MHKDPVAFSTTHQETPQKKPNWRWWMFIMMWTMNLFNHLMRLYMFNNHGNLQPQVIIYPNLVHLHQLQHLLVFKTNHHIPTFIWYPLIWRWNDFTYSTSWRSFIMLTKDHLINQFLYHMLNMLNPKQHPHLFDRELFIHKAPGQWYQYLV